MIFAAVGAYGVFTGSRQPVQLFSISGISIDFGQIIAGSLPPELMGAGGVKNPAQKTEIIPADVMNSLFNLLAHLMLMGFLMNFGSKLASLGIQLLRPIKVSVKEAKE